MLVEKLENNQYIIRIEPSESLMASLEKFARDTQVGFAWINVIGGGFEKVKYAFSVGHDVGYRPIKEVKGPLELLNAEGCIGWDHDDQNKPAVHLHATFIDNELEKAFGGHLMEAEVVGLTAEVKVTVLSSKKKITRKLDERVKVKLLNLSPYSTLVKPENPQQNNPNQGGSAWQVILPVGIIIAGLMAVTAYFILRERKIEKLKKNK
jgi:predicted DNA-binding protein with PD1-like motif